MSPFDPDRRQVVTGIAAAASASALATALPGVSSARAQTMDRGVALVTGCSSGFGRLTAIELARSGFTTFATMRDMNERNRPAADELRALADSDGIDLRLFDIDVRSDEAVQAGMAAASEAGPLDVVVNNAGIIIPGSIELHPDDQVLEQFDTNLFGYHRVARAALPFMRDRGQGLIVNVSSGLGRIVFPTQGWYVATKFAVEGMSEALAYELAPLGVELTILQPTAYPTQFLPNARRYFEALLEVAEADRQAAYEMQIGMTRFGLQDEPGPDPNEIAVAIRELAMTEPGTRPLRRIVSPEPQGLERINGGLAAAQDAVFEGSPFAAWRAAVTD